MKAVICPVCDGTGKIERTGLNDGIPIECHGCKDKDGISRGWVEVSDSDKVIEKEYIPYPIYPSNPIIPLPQEDPIWWLPTIICKTVETYTEAGADAEWTYKESGGDPIVIDAGKRYDKEHPSAEWVYVGNTFVGKNSSGIKIIELN